MKTLIQMPLALILLCGFLSSNVYGRSELSVEYTKTNITCFGQSNGKIELSVKGGKSPYVIEWNNGANSMVLENLKKGEYSVTVTDAQGRKVLSKIEIEMPAPLSMLYNSKKETMVDVVNGSMDIAINGGTPWEVENGSFYFIRLDSKSYIENPLSLQDGVYKINVEDANGCKMNIPVNIDFEIASSNVLIENSMVSKDNKPYNGMGHVNMTLYKPVPVNLVSLKDDAKLDVK